MSAAVALRWLREAEDLLTLDRDQKEEALEPIYARTSLGLATYWNRSAVLLLKQFTPAAWRAMGGLREALSTPDEFLDAFFASLEESEAFDLLAAVLVKEGDLALEAGYEAVANTAALSSFNVRHPVAERFSGAIAGQRIKGLNRTSHAQLQSTISRGIAKGTSYQEVARNLIKQHAEWAVPSPLQHIRSRAELIAVTEMGDAYVQGTMVTARNLQRDGLVMEKHWLTVGDHRVDAAQCATNEAAGWIPLDEDFPSGHNQPLAHPGCRCDVQVRKVASGGTGKLTQKLGPVKPRTPQEEAEALLRQGLGNTEVARRMERLYPGQGWTADKVSGVKRRLGLTAPPKAPPVPKAPPAPKPTGPVFPEGGFKTTKALENWTRENYPHLKVVDFHGAKIENMNPTIREWVRLADKYPEVAARLENITTRPYQITGHRFGNNAMAYATVDGRTIGLNASKEHFGNVDFAASVFRQAQPNRPWGRKYDVELKQIVDITKPEPWHPRGTEPVQSVFTHEFGHQVEHWLRRQTSTALVDHVDAGGRGLVDNLTDRFISKHMVIKDGNALSEYATTNTTEAFAEAFSQLENSPPSTWNPATKALDKFLKVVNDIDRHKVKGEWGWTTDLPLEQARAAREAIDDLYQSVGLTVVR